MPKKRAIAKKIDPSVKFFKESEAIKNKKINLDGCERRFRSSRRMRGMS